MNRRATVSADDGTITGHVPLTFVTPDGAPWAPRPRVDNAMVKALARAFRWRMMLDTGVHATLEDLARAKGVAPSYVSRVLRLTLLAPDIVEAILDGRQPAGLQLDDLLRGFRWSGIGSANTGRARTLQFARPEEIVRLSLSARSCRLVLNVEHARTDIGNLAIYRGVRPLLL